MKKLKEVSMKKALETLGATDIKVNRKGFWSVSGFFTLNGKKYRYGSFDLREVVIPGTDDIDLNAEAPLFYYELSSNGAPIRPNSLDLNDRFAAVGVRVPMSKHEYDPWNAWKRTPKNQKPLKTCGTCANYENGICRATGIIRSVHSLDICHWNKHTPLKTQKK